MPYLEVERCDSVALVWIDQPGEKLNKITSDLFDEFASVLDGIEKDPGIKAAVLISRKPDFIVGADIERILKMDAPGQAASLIRTGHRLLDRVEKFPKPVVAAIHGAALGGGLEVALACRCRIASDDPRTVFALPEVKLGLLPGGGGTQRLPRLVGVSKALDMMLTGKNIYARKAKKLGLVDFLVHPYGLLDAALECARELAAGGDAPERKKQGAPLMRMLESVSPGRRLIYNQARKTVKARTKGNYPAPLKIIDCVEAGTEKGLEAGYRVEERLFDELVLSPEARQLIRLFFGMTGLKKGPPAGLARPVKKVGVLGAGLMGSGIADVSISNGMDVLLKDMTYAALGHGEKAVWDDLDKKVRRGALTPFQRDITFSRLNGILDYSGFRSADLVIEAVFEDIDLKRRILAEVESAAREDTIFASNTSSIPISEIAAQAKRPELVIGMHYFSPVPKMPLLEVIVTEKTADWAAATCVEAGIRQGKHVIVVKDGPGFYTTRILAPFMNEAMVILEEGGDVREIDRAMRQFGFAVGPITLLDEVGIDVVAHVTTVLAPLFTWRGLRTSSSSEKLLQAGYKGRKNRKGFYVYDGGGRWSRTVQAMARKVSGDKGRALNKRIYDFFGGPHRKSFEAREIQDRLTFVMVNEAVHCLQEGIISSPGDGDLGAVLGLGFPPFLGGPFRYLDSMGTEAACRRMDELREKNGPRFIAADLLREKAALKQKFHPE
jgi:3-hydroxyacyl-CoA dehydrogenase/enoyl-CoA hydratase/3-hydroxybutyryl-CoA epimerase